MSSKNQIKYLKKRNTIKQEVKEQKKKNYLIKNMKEYHVDKETELLNYLFSVLRDQSKNNVKALLSKKFIAVNGLCVTQYNYMLYKGDIVQLSKEPFEKTNIKTKKSEQRLPKLDIVYEDDDFLVINKPSGLLSVESDKEKSDTAYKLVLEYMQKKDKFARVFQVHRIDKMTSGILMFTKSYELKEALMLNWNKLVLRREYIAIVEGILDNKKDKIVSYLKETSTHLMYDSKNPNDGLKAITYYEVLKENKDYSLLKVNIDSGRKNQIRVVMESLGHPIIGDDKYNSHLDPLKRLGLHASMLELKHPLTNKIYSFKAKIPSKFISFFN
jgi:RluA family pseudouridine synthase